MQRTREPAHDIAVDDWREFERDVAIVGDKVVADNAAAL
jgi:hypothetical protein